MKTEKCSICQSCGMPMRGAEHCGTNAFGGKNKEYCCYCFLEGNFTDEGITMEEKIKKNIEIAKTMSMPEEEAVNLANTVIPTLKRWQNE